MSNQYFDNPRCQARRATAGFVVGLLDGCDGAVIGPFMPDSAVAAFDNGSLLRLAVWTGRPLMRHRGPLPPRT
jgi:hypothetical protein